MEGLRTSLSAEERTGQSQGVGRGGDFLPKHFSHLGPLPFHMAAFLSGFLLRTLLPFAHNSPLPACPALTLPPPDLRQGEIIHSSPHLHPLGILEVRS